VKNGGKVPLDNVCTKNCGEEGTTFQGRGVSQNVHNDYGPFFVRDEAMDFLRRNGQTPEPFFLHYSPQMPHTNNEGGWDGHGQEVPDYGEFAEESWPKVEQGFAQMMRYLDNDMGQFMFLLDSLGIDDNTLVIFTSDNGPHSEGGHKSNYFNSNGDFRGQKRNFWDGGIREPTAVRWPGVIEASSTTDYIGYSPDFMPTFGELAGMSIPSPTDGKSFVPTLLGKTAEQEQHEYLFWRTKNNSRTIKEGKWKLVNGELFDTELDVGEETNVANQNQTVMNRLNGYITDATAGGMVDVNWTPEAIDPVLVGGCKDASYAEYNEDADYSVASACKNLSPVVQSVRDLQGVTINNLTHSIKVNVQGMFQVKISDVSGRVLWSKSGNNSGDYFFGQYVPEQGMHYITVQTSDGRVSAPWVKL